MPHDSPLHSVHSHGNDEGRLQLHELIVLCTTLCNKVTGLESELKHTKETYNAALTKLIKRVKRLEQTIKTSKSSRRAWIVLLEDEEAAEDPSKQGRKVPEIDEDPNISLLVEDQGSGEKGKKEVTTPINYQTYIRKRRRVSTARRQVSTASEIGSTASEKAKDKGKAIMTEPEPPKKIEKRVQIQMSIDEELAKKILKEDQTRAMAEQEKERINFEVALELQRQLNEREEVQAEATQAPVIDWNDPSIIRYHALQNRPRSVAEVRKNLMVYLKNQGRYKMKDFKGMIYYDIRPIFEKRQDQEVLEEPAETPKTKTEKVAIESSKKARGRRKKSLATKIGREFPSEETAKKYKLDEDTEKEELQGYSTITSEEEGLNVESLSTSYPIVDWQTQILAADKFYYQIKRADRSVKHYSVFSVMLYEFDRQDVLELYRLVKE
ncbi:hypothetical protein Tco_0616417, partial [Tanacetum coccineum]